ncbi:methyltransferase domain-containing protein, partial [Salmonella enterica subsp. enterica serovar Anatum]|nr:methyltransferase domain-containing protein [Salmonella enterica subsp. enterica serovar Anatum]
HAAKHAQQYDVVTCMEMLEHVPDPQSVVHACAQLVKPGGEVFMETADTGLPIHQTKNVLIPRASHNFEFFAEVCQQMNGKTYPV